VDSWQGSTNGNGHGVVPVRDILVRVIDGLLRALSVVNCSIRQWPPGRLGRNCAHKNNLESTWGFLARVCHPLLKSKRVCNILHQAIERTGTTYPDGPT